VKIEIWSDVVCPWCYIGKRRFENALSDYEHASAVDIIWRSFELDPDAPQLQQESSLEHLAQKYGMTLMDARAAQARVSDIAAQEGLDYRLADTQRGNSFDAHRLLQLARLRGVQSELKERLLRGYFTEAEQIGDAPTLERLATQAGLEAREVAETLAGDRFADAVRADEARASMLGIRAVPFFVLNERIGIEGAQPAELILQGLRQAEQEVGLPGPS
jgi:predicted DsbA family dithiol-disulfide isomerase